MVREKLHLICGNCGANNHWRWNIQKDSNDYGHLKTPDVHICCDNCDTVHSLQEVTNYDPLNPRIFGGTGN